jgi:DNA-binding transcriptional LysR family regulator
MDRYVEIETFLRVVDRGSLSSAARSLSMSPSAVSKIISGLEARLDTRLLNRSSRSLALTTDGAAFYEAGARALEAMQDADLAVSTKPAGTLRIQCLPSFGMHQLAPLVPELLEKYPELKLEFILTMGPLDTARGVDVWIHVGPMSDSALVMRRIGGTGYMFCAAPSYIEKHGPIRSLDDLKDHNCLNFNVPTDFKLWSIMDKDGRVRLLEVQGNTSANQGGMLLELARVGVGIVYLADFHAYPDLKSGRLVRLFPSVRTPSDPVYAVYHGRRHLSPRIRVFLDFLSDRFARQWLGSLE